MQTKLPTILVAVGSLIVDSAAATGFDVGSNIVHTGWALVVPGSSKPGYTVTQASVPTTVCGAVNAEPPKGGASGN